MFRSATVVPSKRSSTCAVPEFSEFWRRTSTSVPTGISTEPTLDVERGVVVEVDAEGVVADAEGDAVAARGEDAGSTREGLTGAADALLSPRARERKSSSRARTSAVSARWSVFSL